MNNEDEQARKQRVFRAVMAGLMVGSGVFLAARHVFKFGTDPSLIAATFCGVAVGMFLLQQVKQDGR